MGNLQTTSAITEVTPVINLYEEQDGFFFSLQ